MRVKKIILLVVILLSMCIGSSSAYTGGELEIVENQR